MFLAVFEKLKDKVKLWYIREIARGLPLCLVVKTQTAACMASGEIMD